MNKATVKVNNAPTQLNISDIENMVNICKQWNITKYELDKVFKNVAKIKTIYRG
ncbi:MAG: hypothetical protein ACXAC2_00250 [Candidatus Kariarchaeaceae archaeon]|jgi:hypothetical protein